MTTPQRRPSPASRATRRSRRPSVGGQSFLQRNRTRLAWVAGAIGFVLVAGAFFLNATRPAYACTELFDPTPPPSVAPATEAPATPAPAPSGSPGATTPPVTPPPPGFVQPDEGAVHVATGSTVRYQRCPPASGRHWNDPPNLGPIRAQFYGKDDPAPAPGWVHNLEHGATVVLYSCRTPDGTGEAEACTDAGQQALRDLFSRWPNSPICNVAPGDQTPVIARFDDMAWPYAAVVWGVVLPLQTLDEEAIFDFQAQRAERFNPEPRCADPTPTPGPATPTPTASPGASGEASPGASGEASPGAPPAASPAASPEPSAAASPAASAPPAS